MNAFFGVRLRNPQLDIAVTLGPFHSTKFFWFLNGNKWYKNFLKFLESSLRILQWQPCVMVGTVTSRLVGVRSTFVLLEKPLKVGKKMLKLLNYSLNLMQTKCYIKDKEFWGLDKCEGSVKKQQLTAVQQPLLLCQVTLFNIT